MHTPEEILNISSETGVKKVEKSFLAKCILGFIGGAMISLGYLAYVRISAEFTGTLAGLGKLLGAAVFPIGLIVILLAGGELVTGNMMAVSAALLKKKVSFGKWLINLITITLANAAGALFVAFFFGHILELTSHGAYAQQVLSIAEHKTESGFLLCFLSGIGCNWFVGLALWLCYGAKSDTGKMLGIWFPVMTFVVIGFQHSIANLFLIPAAMFEGHFNFIILMQNFIPVFLGNYVGGGIFVSTFYYFAFMHNKKSVKL